ncbi:hypothetical protein DPMN_126871 [Dreissena polymorpha]|uniref:Uncharacterized protein n=1 Tax=Dreissena polymorpha TaxID=45954 RepID=A0A9D4GWV5_DREPO|nr:hypothetical protein DPMN_126871 [Dreissena polymorpha]
MDHKELNDSDKRHHLTKVREDWTITLAIRVKSDLHLCFELEMFYYSHIIKIAPPPCGHVFQETGTNFEIALISSEQMCSPCFMKIGQKIVVVGIVKINILTKLYQAMSHDTKTEPDDDHID